MARISAEELAKAKQLYMDFMPVTEIARKLGISKNTVRYHATTKDDNWKLQREGAKMEMLEAFNDGKKGKILSVNNLCLAIIQKGLKDINSQETISLKDAKLASDILTEMDKIIKLDDGEATSRSESISIRPISLDAARRRMISADPFMEAPPQEIEYVEMDDDDDDTVAGSNLSSEDEVEVNGASAE